MIIPISIAILCIVLAVIILIGKGDKLIAGYNTASPEEKAKYDIRRLRLVISFLMVLTAIFVASMPFTGGNKRTELIVTAVFVVIVVFGAIFSNFWAKKR